jgi:hypothetical protein
MDIIERLKKVRALSERERMLDALLRKYGLTESDLIDREKRECSFIYGNKWERDLLIQIVGCVLNEGTVTCWRKKKRLIFKLTKLEQAEIGMRYNLYRKAIKNDLHLFFRAFYVKHHIFASSAGVGETPSAKEIARIVAMTRSMGNVVIPRALLGNEE